MLKYLYQMIFSRYVSIENLNATSSPGAETSGKRAVQSLPSSLVGNFLLPDGHVGAIVARTGVKRGQRCAIESIGRLERLKIGFEGAARSFASHICCEYDEIGNGANVPEWNDQPSIEVLAYTMCFRVIVGVVERFEWQLRYVACTFPTAKSMSDAIAPPLKGGSTMWLVYSRHIACG